MADVAVKDIQELRQKTGFGMMDCKRALQENDGDMEAAMQALRLASGAAANKRAGRSGAEGLIVGRTLEDTGALVEVRCETDFVARNEDFIAFANKVLEATFSSVDSDFEKAIKDSFEDQRKQLIQKIGEDLQITRVCRVMGPQIGLYVHNNSRIGAMVSLIGGDRDLAHKLAMHVAAEAPLVISADQMPQERINAERAIYEREAAETSPLPEIQEKIIDGKLKKYTDKYALMDQNFVMDAGVKIGNLVHNAEAVIQSFVRLDVSEGPTE